MDGWEYFKDCHFRDHVALRIREYPGYANDPDARCIEIESVSLDDNPYTICSGHIQLDIETTRILIKQLQQLIG